MALSLAGREALMWTVPSLEIIPASTSLWASMTRGTLSPVSAAVSNVAALSSRWPSMGTRSPAFTSMVSPTLTCEGSTVTRSLPLTTTAWSGRKAMSDLMLPRARSTAWSCRASPMQYSAITATASGYSPMAKAPMLATVISMNSLNTSPSRADSMASSSTSVPVSNHASAYHVMQIQPRNHVTPACVITMPATSITSEMTGLTQFVLSLSPCSCGTFSHLPSWQLQ